MGPDRPVEYEDTVCYFKIHIPGRPSRAICRLINFGEGNPSMWVSLPPEAVHPVLSGREITSPQVGWSRIALSDVTDLKQMGQVLAAAWDQRNAALRRGDQEPTDE